MANFAIAASEYTIQRANNIVDKYIRDGEKKEAGLIRIIELAEREETRGTHPKLAESLNAIDSTISTLITQINGVVAGQDATVAQLRKQLDAAIVEKNTALTDAQKKIDEAQKIKESSEADIENAKAEIEKAKMDAQEIIDKAHAERDQAIRDRDAARAIAAEKTASNDLLMRQAAAAEEDLTAYKQLQNDYAAQHDTVVQLQQQMAVAAAEYETQIAQEHIKMQSEMYEKLGALDRENAKLEAKIEQLKAKIAELTANN